MVTVTEFWRWPESRWTTADKDWKKAKIITCGIDVGSVSSQAVILTDGEMFCYSSRRTGSNSPDSAQNALNWALDGTGMKQSDIQYIIGTGYGRINIPFAHRTLTEIACHARGANYMYGPTVRTVLDMGGQDCKIIRIDENGRVKSFLMNDKCAAGTGRGMEVFADVVGVPIQDVGELSLQVDKEPKPVSSTCVIYAKAEATGRMEQGESVNKVLAAYCSAMAHRVYTLVMRLGVEKEFAITGGIAKNQGVVSRLVAELKVTPIQSKIDPQIAGALGAALFSHAFMLKSGKAA